MTIANDITKKVSMMKELKINRSVAIQTISKTYEIDDFMPIINKIYGEQKSNQKVSLEDRVKLLISFDESMKQKDMVKKMVESKLWGGEATAKQCVIYIKMMKEYARQMNDMK